MATALNMTMKLKQDAASQAKLAGLRTIFAEKVQPAIDKALRDSQIVHFARVLVIEDQYIQVITEFDGDSEVYTDFFRKALPDVFKAIFELAEGAPSWEELNDRDTFFKFSQGKNVKALGSHPTDPRQGYLFEAYPDMDVKKILQKSAAAAGH
jgi:hypothetical protein